MRDAAACDWGRRRQAWITCRSTTSSLCARRPARRGRWRWPPRTAPTSSRPPRSCWRRGRVAAVRVTKETLDADTREFQSVTILSKGEAEAAASRKVGREPRAALRQPAGPLHRPRPRPHRPAAGRLAGPQPRHAVRAAAPARPGREARRRRQRAAARHPEDRRARGAGARHLGARADPQLPEPDRARDRPRAWATAQARRFPTSPRRPSPPPPSALRRRAGGGLPARRRRRRLPGRRRRAGPTRSMRLLDLADAAPAGTAPRARSPSRCWSSRCRRSSSPAPGLIDLLGAHLDLGGQLAAMTRLVGRATPSTRWSRIEPRGRPRRCRRCKAPRRGWPTGWRSRRSPDARAAVGRRILRELMGPRRLRPSDPEGRDRPAARARHGADRRGRPAAAARRACRRPSSPARACW